MPSSYTSFFGFLDLVFWGFFCTVRACLQILSCLSCFIASPYNIVNALILLHYPANIVAVKGRSPKALTPELSFSGGRSSSVPSHIQRKICLWCTVSMLVCLELDLNRFGFIFVWFFFLIPTLLRLDLTSCALFLWLHGWTSRARQGWALLLSPMSHGHGSAGLCLTHLLPAQGRASPWSSRAVQSFHVSLIRVQNRNQCMTERFICGWSGGSAEGSV